MNLPEIIKNLIKTKGIDYLNNTSNFLTSVYEKINSNDLEIQFLILNFMYETYGNLFKTFYMHKDDFKSLNHFIEELIKLLEKDKLSPIVYAYPIYSILAALDIEVDHVSYNDPRDIKKDNVLPNDLGYGLSFDDQSMVIQNNILVKYSGQSSLVVIPNFIKEIAKDCFIDNTTIKFVITSENLRKISESVFKNCSSLKYIYLPNSLEVIEKSAFFNCVSLRKISLSEHLKEIHEQTFENCRNLKVMSTNKFTYLGKRAFYECLNINDLSLYIDSNTVYEKEAFAKCYLDHLFIKNTNEHISVYFSKEEFPNSIKCSYLVNGVQTYYYIPQSLKSIKVSVPFVPEHIFDGIIINHLEFDENVSVIKSNTFDQTKISQITIGNENIMLGDGTLSGLDKTQINFHNKDINVYDNLYIVYKSVLVNIIDKSLSEYKIPQFFKQIKPGIFDSCDNIKSIIIENGDDFQSVKSILGKATEKIEKLSVNLSIIKDEYFSNMTLLEKLIITGNPKEIGFFAFENCQSLENFEIPQSVRIIHDFAFSNCLRLNSLSIHKDIESIGYSILSGCYRLHELSFPSSIKGKSPVLSLFGHESYDNSYAITQVISENVKMTYYVPYSLKRIRLIDGFITQGLFSNCENIVIDVDSHRGNIGKYAFYNCKKLNSFVIDVSSRIIGDYAFYGCENNTHFSVGKSITKLGDYAFSKCSKLISLDLYGIKMIAGNAFDESNNIQTINFNGYSNYIQVNDFVINKRDGQLVYVVSSSNKKELIIPSQVKRLGSRHFTSLSQIKMIDLSQSGISSIDPYAFDNCTQLEEVKLNHELQSVGEYAFNNCTNLNTISLPPKIAFIRSYAFSNCKSIRSFHLPYDIMFIDSYAFHQCDPRLTIYQNNLQNIHLFGSRWQNRSFFFKIRRKTVLHEEDIMSKKKKITKNFIHAFSLLSLVVSMMIGVFLATRLVLKVGNITIPINEIQSVIAFFSKNDHALNIILSFVSASLMFISVIGFTLLFMYSLKEQKGSFAVISKQTSIITNSIKELAILREKNLITEDEYTRRKNMLVKAGDKI